jgi:hypothetical protein
MSSSIGGERRTQTSFSKKVGLFAGRVLCVNPDAETYKEVLGIELRDDSKATEYLGVNDDGNNYLRIDIWLEDVKGGGKYPATFFLENKERENKEGTKTQYINEVGICTWAADPNDLPTWFIGGDGKNPPREYRVAKVGEEELYNFLRTWLSELDYRVAATTLQIEWKKLMKGNVKDIEEQIGGEWCNNVVALVTVKIKEVDGEMKEIQRIFNKTFLPSYSLKQFRLVNYSDPIILENLKKKKSKDLKSHEKFALSVSGEYGCRDVYYLGDIKDYNPEEYLVSSNRVISAEDSTY